MRLSDEIVAFTNAIFEESTKINKELRQITLQKYLYFSCGYAYALWNTWPLGKEDNFEARMHGPVMPSVYNAYKHFSDVITPRYMPTSVQLPRSSVYLIKQVIEKYKNYGDFALSAKTHEQNTPWAKTIQEKLPYIRRRDIKTYFKDILKEDGYEDFEVSKVPSVDISPEELSKVIKKYESIT